MQKYLYLLVISLCSFFTVMITDAPKAHALAWQYQPVGSIHAPWRFIGQNTWSTGDPQHNIYLQLHLYSDNTMEMHAYIPNSLCPQEDQKSEIIFYDLSIFPHSPVHAFRTSYQGQSDSLQDKNLSWAVFSTQRSERGRLAHLVRRGTALAWIVFDNNHVIRLYDPASHPPKLRHHSAG